MSNQKQKVKKSKSEELGEMREEVRQLRDEIKRIQDSADAKYAKLLADSSQMAASYKSRIEEINAELAAERDFRNVEIYAMTDEYDKKRAAAEIDLKKAQARIDELESEVNYQETKRTEVSHYLDAANVKITSLEAQNKILSDQLVSIKLHEQATTPVVIEVPKETTDADQSAG